MRVIICGAGKVGSGIAERLSEEDNSVTVIDNSPELTRKLSDSLDVKCVVGYASHPETLEKAGAQDADMIIAVTLSDEVNMIACQIAHSIFNVPQKIARVRAQSYLQPQLQDLFARDHMPIDMIISPEIEVGNAILRQLSHNGITDNYYFSDGAVTLIATKCLESCPIVNTPLRQLSELFPSHLTTIVGIQRQDRLFTPTSDDQLMIDDEVIFISPSEQVERILQAFGYDQVETKNILIIGGGNVGKYVATELEKISPKTNIKIIEANHDIALQLAEKLDRTVVLHGSGLQQELLYEAGAHNADILIALTNDDKVNILSAVMAKQLGCKKTLSLIVDKGFHTIIKDIGIDSHINPRTTTISKILQNVRSGRIFNVYTLSFGKAEILEAEALKTSPMVGKPLRDLDLPKGVKIGAITRNGETIPLSGETKIEVSDNIVIFTLQEHVAEVESYFKVGIDFF